MDADLVRNGVAVHPSEALPLWKLRSKVAVHLKTWICWSAGLTRIVGGSNPTEHLLRTGICWSAWSTLTAGRSNPAQLVVRTEIWRDGLSGITDGFNPT